MSQPTAIYDDVAGGSYVRGYYGVPAYRDGRIHFGWDNRTGTIVGFDDQYLLVLFDGETDPARLHPTWQVEYLDAPASPALPPCEHAGGVA